MTALVEMDHIDECSQICSQEKVVQYFSINSEFQLRSETHWYLIWTNYNLHRELVLCISYQTKYSTQYAVNFILYAYKYTGRNGIDSISFYEWIHNPEFQQSIFRHYVSKLSLQLKRAASRMGEEVICNFRIPLV